MLCPLLVLSLVWAYSDGHQGRRSGPAPGQILDHFATHHLKNLDQLAGHPLKKIDQFAVRSGPPCEIGFWSGMGRLGA